MSKKTKTKRTENPEHYLFGNNVLNQLFCATPESADEFCDEAVRTFVERLPKDDMLGGPKKVRAHFLSYLIAHIETAFELGWREALKREALPALWRIHDCVEVNTEDLRDMSEKGGAA